MLITKKKERFALSFLSSSIKYFPIAWLSHALLAFSNKPGVRELFEKV